MNRIQSLICVLALISLPFSLYAQKPNYTDYYELENGSNKTKLCTNGNKERGAKMYAKGSVKSGGHWKVINMGGGLIRIQNKNSKMYLANFGSTEEGSAIKQTPNPGSGALWRLVQLQGGYYKIVNNLSNMALSLKSIPNNSQMQGIQTNRVSGLNSWKFKKVVVSGTSNTSETGFKKVAALGPKLTGKYSIMSRNASKNDVIITAKTFQEGRLIQNIVEIYFDGEYYKVIKTVNGYYSCAFVKYRAAGKGTFGRSFSGDGVFINSGSGQAFTTIQDARKVNKPGSFDEGFRK